MGENFEAGSIVVQLRSQIESLQKGFAQAKALVQQLGDGVKTTAKAVEQSGQVISNTFNKMDRQSVQMAARFARFTNRLLGLQFAIHNLQTVSQQGFGRFQKVVDAATSGLSTFAAVASLLPNRTGLIVGAIAGITTALVQLLAPTKDAIQAGFDAAKITETVSEALSALQKIPKDTALVSKILGGTPLETVRAELEGTKALVGELLKLQQDFLARRREVAAQLQAAQGNEFLGFNLDKDLVESLKNQLAGIDRFLENVPEKLEEIQKRIQNLRLAESVQAARQAVKDLNAELEDGNKLARTQFQLGMINPLQQAQQEARNAEAALNALIQKSIEFERTTGRKSAEIGTEISSAADRAGKAKALADRMAEVDRLATNFSSAIGQGIVDGILAGQSAMEILANTGRNLFENFLRDTVNNFQTMMTDAFKAITGVAGAELGTLFSALAGIAGFFLSKASKDSAQERFNAVKSNIESSQAVRGVVAGPTSVAIASVGENIERAFEPSRQLLAAILQQVQAINSNTRGRGGPGGGFPAVGAPVI